MGWNAKTAHAAYDVAPAAQAVVPAVDDKFLEHLVGVCAGEVAPESEAEDKLELVAVIVNGGLDSNDPHAPPLIDLPDDPVEQYAMFAEAVAAASAAGSELQDSGEAAFQQQLRDLCAQYLGETSFDDLDTIAVQAGFAYPQLVGLSDRSPHPIAVWLDPTQPSETKLKIEGLAQARYAELCAGHTVGGLTLAEWNLPAPATASLPPGFAAWHATAADLEQLQTHFTDLAAKITKDSAKAGPDDYAALVRCENQLATAESDTHTTDLNLAVASAQHTAGQLLASAATPQLISAINDGRIAGTITDAELQVLNAHQALDLVRATTSPEQRAAVQSLAAERAALLAKGMAGTAALEPIVAALPALTEPNGFAVAGAAAEHLHAVATLQHAAAEWDAVEPPALQLSKHVSGQGQMLEWAAEQKTADLRKFLDTNGILSSEHAGVATKSGLEHALSSHLSASMDAIAIIKHELQAKYETTSAKPPPPKSKPAPVVIEPRGTFGQQHAQLVAALHQAQAAHAAVPKTLDPAAVAAWDFGAGQPATLGGTHPKTLHTGPDGAIWIAKGEAQPRGGAVTHAEAAASRMVARAGLPAVPVYATSINGKPVSVQPMLPGAKPMSGSVSSWSQADVDEVVRLHVTSWALGNHDPHQDNVLRTEDGGLVPVDQGQSFKNFGQDKLTLGYRPSTTTVYHRVYDAHLAGSLPKGVQVNPAVAHSVIRRLESVPDVEWRAMLHTAAHTGAAQKAMKWVPAMRARAAEQHGIAENAVTTTQIAESFLDHAVERKKNLRRDFVTFFTDELKLTKAAALQHLGKT